MYNQNQKVGPQINQQSQPASLNAPYPMPPSVETVESSLNLLAQEVSILQDAIQQLAISIAPILLVDTSGSGEQTSGPSYGVDVIDQIQSQIIRIRASNVQLNDLRSRNRV